LRLKASAASASCPRPRLVGFQLLPRLVKPRLSRGEILLLETAIFPDTEVVGRGEGQGEAGHPVRRVGIIAPIVESAPVDSRSAAAPKKVVCQPIRGKSERSRISLRALTVSIDDRCSLSNGWASKFMPVSIPGTLSVQLASGRGNGPSRTIFDQLRRRDLDHLTAKSDRFRERNPGEGRLLPRLYQSVSCRRQLDVGT
jgi:hypothetical protein